MEKELLEIIKAQVLATYGHHEPHTKENNNISKELQRILDGERESIIKRYSSEWMTEYPKNNSR